MLQRSLEFVIGLGKALKPSCGSQEHVVLGEIDTNEVYYARVFLAICPKTTGEPCRSYSGSKQVSE